MADRMDDTPDSTGTTDSNDDSQSKKRSVFLNDGGSADVETIHGDVNLESHSSSTSNSTPSSSQEKFTTMPEGVTNFFGNKGHALTANTIKGDLKMKHTHGNPRQ